MKCLSILLSCCPLIATLHGIENDHFANATELLGDLPLNQWGSLVDPDTGEKATMEDGEPDHAGIESTGSVWYSWTASETGKFKVQVGKPKRGMQTVLAAYTGDSLDKLVLVHRYKQFAYPAFSRSKTEPFTRNAFVQFDARKGTKYYFSVTSENEVCDRFHFMIHRCSNKFNPQMELVEPGSKWKYLLARSADGEPVDPESLDPDFFYTWMTPSRYDGPSFKVGRTPIGYGVLSFDQLRKNAGGKRNYLPPVGFRNTIYLRKTFTPLIDVTDLGIEGVFDDGAIIYINGKERARLNVSAGENPHNWLTPAKSDMANKFTSTEKQVRYRTIKNVNLPANVPVQIAISLHNNDQFDEDLGTDLRLYALAPDYVVR